jgi:hypothetical protein
MTILFVLDWGGGGGGESIVGVRGFNACLDTNDGICIVWMDEY